MGIIYCAVNLVNGKKYVGKTVQTLEDRWKSHIQLANTGRKIYFLNAIRKYGPESFSLSVLETVEESLLNEAERRWIKELNTTDPAVWAKVLYSEIGRKCLHLYCQACRDSRYNLKNLTEEEKLLRAIFNETEEELAMAWEPYEEPA